MMHRLILAASSQFRSTARQNKPQLAFNIFIKKMDLKPCPFMAAFS